MPFTINTHRVEELGVLATNDGYEHVPSSKENEQGIGDEMCEMAFVITLPFQHFVEPNELEHNGDQKEDEQNHVQRRLGRFLPIIFFHMHPMSSYGLCLVIKINSKHLIKLHPTLPFHVRGRWGFFCHFFVAILGKGFGC